MFRKALSVGLWAVVGMALVGGCGAGAGVENDDDTLGRVAIALTGVPADGTCIQVEAVGYRTVRQNFVATAGSSQVFQMKGLPVGQVSFTAAAFGGVCPQPDAAVAANWVSDAPFTTNVAVSPASVVTLNLVRNGAASVAIGFNDQPDGGAAEADAAAIPTDAAPQADGSTGGMPMDPPPANRSFMQIAGVMGESQEKGFEGWFTIDNFTLKTTSSVSAGGGGGAGVGKTNWTMTASLRLQKGMPQLFELAVTGKNINFVNLALASNSAIPSTLWGAKLETVSLAGIQALNGAMVNGAPVPSHTITFVFQKIEVTTANGPSTIKANWDLRANTGSGPGLDANLRFAVGAPGAPPSKPIISFVAPSETSAGGGVGGGAGAGKATFSDASITLPVDATALGMLTDGAKGKVTPSLLVEFLSAAMAGGKPDVVGSYGFEKVQFTGVTFSGLTATVSFRATVFSWIFGNETVKYDAAKGTKV